MNDSKRSNRWSPKDVEADLAMDEMSPNNINLSK